MTVNIREISIMCGNCGTYQTLCGFERRNDVHVYRYECETEVCQASVTRTLVEVPRDLDEFARRDHEWRSGSKESIHNA